jgi:hypothetical protein
MLGSLVRLLLFADQAPAWASRSWIEPTPFPGGRGTGDGSLRSLLGRHGAQSLRGLKEVADRTQSRLSPPTGAFVLRAWNGSYLQLVDAGDNGFVLNGLGYQAGPASMFYRHINGFFVVLRSIKWWPRTVIVSDAGGTLAFPDWGNDAPFGNLFAVVFLGEYTVALRAGNGKFLRVGDANEGFGAAATAATVGPWETFTVETATPPQEESTPAPAPPPAVQPFTWYVQGSHRFLSATEGIIVFEGTFGPIGKGVVELGVPASPYGGTQKVGFLKPNVPWEKYDQAGAVIWVNQGATLAAADFGALFGMLPQYVSIRALALPTPALDMLGKVTPIAVTGKYRQ